MKENSHPYCSTENCVKRLVDVWRKYVRLIVATDFDETVCAYHQENKGFCYDRVIEIIQDLTRLGCEIIVFTSGLNSRHQEMKEFLEGKSIKISGFNQNSGDLPFGKDGAKLYYNVLLDDKAGLGQTCDILESFIKKVSAAKLYNL